MISFSEWMALAGFVLTIVGALLASYIAIKVELVKLGSSVNNFSGHVERIDRELHSIREVIDRRHGVVTRH